MLIIGVVAALAISAATLVLFIGNVQGNTADTRQHVKSFTVCEAGLDVGMALLSDEWPRSATSVPDFDESGFEARVDSSRFPQPKNGDFIDVTWYDDQDPIDKSIDYDANDDGILWMVSQAGVGSRPARVITQVQRSYFQMALPHGIPLWAGGDLYSNGGGNNPKSKSRSRRRLTVGSPRPSTSAGPSRRPTSPPTESPEDWRRHRAAGSDLPADAGRLTQDDRAEERPALHVLAAAEASPVNETLEPTGGLSGLVVIEPTTIVELRSREHQPELRGGAGIFLILGGSTRSVGVVPHSTTA